MKIVGPFAAARQLDPATGSAAATPPAVSTWQALDRVTGMPALVYLLPYGTPLPKLPDSPLLLPYTDRGSQDRPEKLSYAACDLPPTAQLCSDPQRLTQMGLRALMALHEAGVVHGAVSPQQFWEDDGELLLAGAGLPWSEAPAPYRAPEGGRSVAADLYAFGVTLLRLGPLPAGLSDLLSPYPAQRPSARDALALMNAGPPLPPLRVPLVVDAPRAKLPEEVVSEAEPLPLVADPDFRAPDIDLQDTVLVPDTQSRLDRQRREQLQPRRVVDLPPVVVAVQPPPAAQPPVPAIQAAGEATREAPAAPAAPAARAAQNATAGSGPRVVRITVKAEPAQDSSILRAEAPLTPPSVADFPAPLVAPGAIPSAPPTPAVTEQHTPRLGLADAMPVRGRVLGKPGERESRRDPLREVLREVQPVGDVAVNQPELPLRPEPVSAAPEVIAVPEPWPAEVPSQPPEADNAEAEHLSAQVDNPAPALAQQPSEWVEEWSAQGLVFSTLPPEATLRQPAETGAQRASALAEALTEATPAAALADTRRPAVEGHQHVEKGQADTSAPPVPPTSAAVPVSTLPTRREFRPVKMAWNPDGSWQVKHDDAPPATEAEPVQQARALAGHLLENLRQGLERWQRQRAERPATATPPAHAETLSAPPEAGPASLKQPVKPLSAPPVPGSAAAGKSRLSRLLRRKDNNRERLLARAVTPPRVPEAPHSIPDYFLPNPPLDPAPVDQTGQMVSGQMVPGQMDWDPAPPHPEAVPVADLIVLSPETIPDEPPLDELPLDEPPASEALLAGAKPTEMDGVAAQPAAAALSSGAVGGPVATSRPVVRAVRRSEAEPLTLPEPLLEIDESDIKPVIRTDPPELPKKPALSFLPWSRAAPHADVSPSPRRPLLAWVRGRLAATPRWWWLVLVASLLLGLLLWALARRNAQVGGHITPPSSCCSLQVQVYSPEGERLSVPVDIIAAQLPPGSKLALGSALGRAPGYINVDVPGHYRLGLQAESYQRAYVNVDLPRSTPLNITLQ